MYKKIIKDSQIALRWLERTKVILQLLLFLAKSSDQVGDKSED
jgi:hypothetical protein